MFKTLIKNLFGCGCGCSKPTNETTPTNESSCCATDIKKTECCTSKDNEVKHSETNEVEVILESAIMNRVLVEKLLRTLTDIDSNETSKTIQSLPATIAKGVDKQKASDIKEKLEELGAKVTIK